MGEAGAPGLPWGRRYLMCPPDYYGILYEINPWMSREVPADPFRARAEWEALVASLREAGAEIEIEQPRDGWPDLVFTANAGVVNGTQFVASRFRHPERHGETPFDVQWFRAHGFEVSELPPGVMHEGAGDALPFGGVLLTGYRMRSDAAAGLHLSRLTGAPVWSVELVDPRLYHLDLTFCPLDELTALCAAQGWDDYGRRVVEALVPEPLWLEDDEVFSFCANSVVVGKRVIMPSCSTRLEQQLATRGFEVLVSPVGEFVKAGGGCRCLTLALDVDLQSHSSVGAKPRRTVFSDTTTGSVNCRK